MPKTDPYEGREQALVKHEVLRRYLERLAFKIGVFQPGTTLNYVDGFSGPWDSASEDHRDSSPVIAMRQLAKARDALAGRQPSAPMRVRAMFVEKNREAFQRLARLCATAPIEAIALFGQFEDHIEDAAKFASRGPRPFAFVFIDPTGWKGFALHRIKPLLLVRPSEVLINFMTKDIVRFIDDTTSDAAESFEELFGQKAAIYRESWRGLTGLDRQEAIVRAYCSRVREEGGFAHCVSTIIANPRADRTHYHLVFATRNLKGLITFREIERSVARVQQDTRARAKQKERQTRLMQRDLFTPSEMDTGYFRKLTARYHRRARAELESSLDKTTTESSYDAIVANALKWPMTSENDVKHWLNELTRNGRIKIVGLRSGERVPKVGAGHTIRRVA